MSGQLLWRHTGRVQVCSGGNSPQLGHPHTGRLRLGGPSLPCPALCMSTKPAWTVFHVFGSEMFRCPCPRPCPCPCPCPRSAAHMAWRPFTYLSTGLRVKSTWGISPQVEWRQKSNQWLIAIKTLDMVLAALGTPPVCLRVVTYLSLDKKATSLSLFTFMHWRRKWQPTPVFLPGESQGPGSLVGFHLWGRTESDTTEVT